MLRLLTGLAIASTALPAADAVLVTPNSQCSTSCGNVLSSTAPSDIGCYDDDFTHDDAQIFAGCVKCEMGSRFVNGDHSDVKSSLYNMRYVVSSCLWGTPSKKHMLNDNPCITSKACENFEKAITYHNVSSSDTEFEYCADWDIHNDIDFKGCTDCLQAGSNFVLANFVTSLKAGCEQRPEKGITLGLEGNVFSSDKVQIVPPSPIATVDPAWFDHGPLNLGAKVGIAIGGFVFLLIILGIFVVCNGKRRRKAYLRKLEEKYTQRGWPSASNRGDMLETPSSAHPLRGGFQDSPMSPMPPLSPMSPTGPYPPYVSPYQSQYNSPVSAQDMVNMPWPAAALPKDHNIGVAVGGDEGVREQWNVPQDLDVKGKGVAESYEMHDVESSKSSERSQWRTEMPVLSHPDHWQQGNNGSHHEQLAEQDGRQGNII